MKLLAASFRNFRLLKSLDLAFSTSATKRLTVIRAANETGKTTMLTALQWALYGDAALPGKGVDFRLHPIDCDGSARVPIIASVDFEVTKVRQVGDTTRETRHKYRLNRTAH